MPLFALLGTGWVWLIILVEIAFGILLTINDGTLATFLAELFPTSVRYTGFALAFNLCQRPARWYGSVRGDLVDRCDGFQRGAAWYLTVIAVRHSAPCSWRRKPLLKS